MGCDIHAYVEATETWESGQEYIDHHADIDFGRNYMAFGVLAGVRYMIDPVETPKGIPKDLSYLVREKYYTTVVTRDRFEDYIRNCQEGNYCTLAWAKEHLKGDFFGKSEWVEKKSRKEMLEFREYGTITYPYWHTPSWLSLEEVEKAREVYHLEAKEQWEYENEVDELEEDEESIEKRKPLIEVAQKKGYIPIEVVEQVEEEEETEEKFFRCTGLELVYATMKTLKDLGNVPRFVFWFDS